MRDKKIYAFTWTTDDTVAAWNCDEIESSEHPESFAHSSVLGEQRYHVSSLYDNLSFVSHRTLMGSTIEEAVLL